MVNALIDWFIPVAFRSGRTEGALARIFVFTHLFGPIIASPMALFLIALSGTSPGPAYFVVGAIASFWLLPFVLKFTGRMTLVALASFQILVTASLVGSFFYGGYTSPFVPWLVVALMLGLFYVSKRPGTVLAIFSADIALFIAAHGWFGFRDAVPLDELQVLGWLSVAAAAVYMSWMALYYARIIALRTELEGEALRYQKLSADLEHARAVAETTGKTRARFFAKMSHELRTPLNAIIGYSDILLEDCEDAGAAGETRKRDVTRINKAGKHLLSLVSDVLDGDKLDAGGSRVEISAFTLAELCDDVTSTALPLIGKNGNAYQVQCTQQDAVLETDRTKLRQILINLLGNAAKFTKKGTIHLECAVSKGCEPRLVATVRDTGIGIAPDALPRLFANYEQADAGIAGTYGGTGLGLALARKLTVLLGGEINVTSRVGHGSAFTIEIPTHLQTALSAEAQPGVRPGEPRRADEAALAA